MFGSLWRLLCPLLIVLRLYTRQFGVSGSSGVRRFRSLLLTSNRLRSFSGTLDCWDHGAVNVGPGRELLYCASSSLLPSQLILLQLSELE